MPSLSLTRRVLDPREPIQPILVMGFSNSAAKDGFQWQDCYSFRELRHIFSVIIFSMTVSHASKIPKLGH